MKVKALMDMLSKLNPDEDVFMMLNCSLGEVALCDMRVAEVTESNIENDCYRKAHDFCADPKPGMKYLRP